MAGFFPFYAEYRSNSQILLTSTPTHPHNHILLLETNYSCSYITSATYIHWISGGKHTATGCLLSSSKRCASTALDHILSIGQIFSIFYHSPVSTNIFCKKKNLLIYFTYHHLIYFLYGKIPSKSHLCTLSSIPLLSELFK